MSERISCTVDELAEALAAEIPGLYYPNDAARNIASFLSADRVPEPATDSDEDWIYE